MNSSQPPPGNISSLQDNYRLLRIYAWYRALLATLLFGMFASGLLPNTLGKIYPLLYSYAVSIYIVASLFTLARLFLTRQTPSTLTIFSICLVDIVTLTIIMHSSGGITSNLGSLIFITVAAGSIFLRGQLATLLAALACIAILIESVLASYVLQMDSDPLGAALLGTLLFVTSQLFQYLTRRILISQLSANEQAAQTATLQRLNEMIVQRMHTGIAVLDSNLDILLCNTSGKKLLEITPQQLSNQAFNFGEHPTLGKWLRNWQQQYRRPPPLQLREGSPEIQLNFSHLENPGNDLTLVFIEDTRQMAQRAQQLKLASLGQLTASIAHEVRNPLGAISHAAQLLTESPSLDSGDLRLATIIQTQTLRVNRIIENVLQLSRRQAPAPERRDLCEWLAKFVLQFRQAHPDTAILDLQTPDYALPVYVDFSQLEQVLENLCQNGLRYSEKTTGEARICLRAYRHPSLDIPCLDVIDYGAGVPEADRDRIFEPFFTTDNKGTGLGLYIARELCLINQTSLNYKHTEEGLSCFQISFPHSDKMMN